MILALQRVNLMIFACMTKLTLLPQSVTPRCNTRLHEALLFRRQTSLYVTIPQREQFSSNARGKSVSIYYSQMFKILFYIKKITINYFKLYL
ncbi:hypothetical protein DBV23_00875 [Edwardsiella ictaluri]|nr:hypothetical protein DBV23_00875 [Edwardsiella ictaluri]